MGASTFSDAYDAVPTAHRGDVRLFQESLLEAGGTYPRSLLRPRGFGCCCNLVVRDKLEQNTVYFHSSRVAGAPLCQCNTTMACNNNEP
jgi:hypothetical protein